MRRFFSYLGSAEKLLGEYRGTGPFSSFSKQFFSRNPKYGGTDRKKILQLCYGFFRLGKSLSQWATRDRVIAGYWMMLQSPDEMLEALDPELNKGVDRTIPEKLEKLNIDGHDVFPFTDELSDDIIAQPYIYSIFEQPDLFIRIRPGMEAAVIGKLKAADIAFKQISSSALALSNATRIDAILDLDREVVVQDLNSQRIGDFYRSAINNLESRIRMWDCCAASGGKSILCYDVHPAIELTVSDSRESILYNLNKRFQKAGIRNFRSFADDLSVDRPGRKVPGSPFNLVLADVPCSGSGTWGRTPEQLYFFEKAKIDHYTGLQRDILTQVIPHLENPGYLLYSTCTVFKKENEEQVQFLVEKFGLTIVEMKTLAGYTEKADSMFVAVMKKE